MKRLMKKSETLAPIKIGDEVKLTDDAKYKDLTMDVMSRISSRDGAVIINTKDGVAYWGFNGESHADLLNKYYNIDLDNNEIKREDDAYMTYGIYLKDFLGSEAVILYSIGVLPGVEAIIQKDKPGIAIYEEKWETETLLKIAKKR